MSILRSSKKDSQLDPGQPLCTAWSESHGKADLAGTTVHAVNINLQLIDTSASMRNILSAAKQNAEKRRKSRALRTTGKASA